jgi:hypothetical protein
MNLPVCFLTLLPAVACVPAAVESGLFRAVRTPSCLFSLFSRDFNRSLLIVLALLTDFLDEL